MSLRPPSTSPSPSPGPHDNNGKINVRQSMGPSSVARGTPTLAPASPRPGAQSSARPTSELLGSGGAMFQTPEAEALDQWFENLQNYEATLEDMAAASLDVNFKEELSAIEQWFKVLSEAERTAALYSLLQHSTQVQIRFFITVLQQMARSDPMTALLSPAMGGSMQSQMEAKLASIKSPGLKSGLPASPTGRSFPTGAGNRQSINMYDNAPPPNTYLSPDAAANAPSSNNNNNNNATNEAAAQTLAQQRAKLKASNASHRISAPVLSAGGGLMGDGRASWGPSTLLSQVSEQLALGATQQEGGNGSGNGGSGGGTTSRPKSTEFSGTPKGLLSSSPVPPDGASGQAGTPTNANAGNANANNNNNNNNAPNNTANTAQSVLGNDSWASMVNTPLVPMFKKSTPADTSAHHGGGGAGGAGGKDWHHNPGPGVPRMGDPTIHRRNNPKNNNNNNSGGGQDVMYDDNGNPVHAAQGRAGGGGRNVSGGSWARGQGLGGAGGNNSSSRFDGSDAGGANSNNNNANNNAGNNNNNNGNMPNFPLGSPTLGMGLQGMQGLGMQPMSPFNMNNMLSMMNMNMSPEAQMLAAQMAASGFGQPGGMGMGWMGMQPLSAGIGSAGIMGGLGGLGGMGGNMGGPGGAGGGGRKGPGSARSPNGLRSASSVGGHSLSGSGGGGHSTPKAEDDVDPALLNDVAAWLRSLRLHKYTPNFEGSRWQDMVMMDEEALERKGVAALGARRKMLKTFELVRKKMGIEGGPESAGLTSP